MGIGKRKKTVRRTMALLAMASTHADKSLSRETNVDMPNLPVSMRRTIDEWVRLSEFIGLVPTPEQRALQSDALQDRGLIWVANHFF